MIRGWHELLPAGSVLPGRMAEVSVGDVDVVVWRTGGGEPCVMEARCPHQWSHLGATGVVDGDEMVCLSHMWRFEVDGSGWKFNLKGRRDRKGDIEVYPCAEHDGAIWARVGDRP